MTNVLLGILPINKANSFDDIANPNFMTDNDFSDSTYGAFTVNNGSGYAYWDIGSIVKINDITIKFQYALGTLCDLAYSTTESNYNIIWSEASTDGIITRNNNIFNNGRYIRLRNNGNPGIVLVFEIQVNVLGNTTVVQDTTDEFSLPDAASWQSRVFKLPKALRPMKII
jgi:hypothetical protein